PAGVAGIWYKDPSGSIVKNPLRPFRQDLDSLPFPNWDHWDIERYLKANEGFAGELRLIASRGCPYSCAFCSNAAIRESVPGNFFRLRKPERVIEEVQNNKDKYYGWGMRCVYFTDDIFGLGREHMRQFCSAYIQSGLSTEIAWRCQTRADFITEEWAGLASSAGCRMVSLGVESGDERIRREVYNKRITDRQITEAARILTKYNIMYCINIMVGCPEDSALTIRRSLEMIRETQAPVAIFSLYQPLPKTALAERIWKDKRLSSGAPFSSVISFRWGFESPSIHTKYLTAAQVRKIIFKIRLLRIWVLCMRGFQARGAVFIFDILREVLSLIWHRRPVFHSYSFAALDLRVAFWYFNKKRNIP
ncbi:MAG: radical SAM protein, partial [Candidatus Omnitrophica bacterium]|nr:radical SAM protein [Candidatus Omnitrophota bacterium]